MGMTPSAAIPIDADPMLALTAPLHQTLALVLASPHSGRSYPEEFLALSQLDQMALRRSEDSFVDELFADAPQLGAPLLAALFPRAYVDPNREPFELDPGMFDGPLPAYANVTSPRVAAGLGTLAKVVADGERIYREPLPVAEAFERIQRFYRPYHAALGGLVEATRQRFGVCILLDCHSMPSVREGAGSSLADPSARPGRAQRPSPVAQGAPVGRTRQKTPQRSDIVLGDAHGRSCSPLMIATAERVLRERGYSVVRNVPYSGGFTTRHYGRPELGVHALQIEIDRALYMNEAEITRRPEMARVAADMATLVTALGELSPAALALAEVRP